MTDSRWSIFGEASKTPVSAVIFAVGDIDKAETFIFAPNAEQTGRRAGR